MSRPASKLIMSLYQKRFRIIYENQNGQECQYIPILFSILNVVHYIYHPLFLYGLQMWALCVLLKEYFMFIFLVWTILYPKYVVYNVLYDVWSIHVEKGINYVYHTIVDKYKNRIVIANCNCIFLTVIPRKTSCLTARLWWKVQTNQSHFLGWKTLIILWSAYQLFTTSVQQE